MLTLPALRVLNPGNGLVRHFDIKAPVNLDNLELFRMHTVDGDVQMDIVRIFVQAVDGLVVFPSEFFHEDAYCFFHLLRAGLLALSPTHDVVIDRVLAAHGFSGKGYHFFTLCGVAVTEETAPVGVQHLFIRVLVVRLADVVGQVADAPRLVLGF